MGKFARQIFPFPCDQRSNSGREHGGVFMRRYFLLLVLLFFGCTTTTIPVYLPSKKPYVKRFYVNYDAALSAIEQTLKDLGWQVEKKLDPAVYEQLRASDLDEKQILVITKIRQISFVIGTRYARMNIYLRSKKSISEIEIRYLTLSSLTLKSLKDYSNDSEVKRIWGKLEEILNKAKN